MSRPALAAVIHRTRRSCGLCPVGGVGNDLLMAFESRRQELQHLRLGLVQMRRSPAMTFASVVLTMYSMATLLAIAAVVEAAATAAEAASSGVEGSVRSITARSIC